MRQRRGRCRSTEKAVQPVRVIAHGPGDGNDDHASATGGHCAGGDQGGEDQHKQNQHPNEDEQS